MRIDEVSASFFPERSATPESLPDDGQGRSPLDALVAWSPPMQQLRNLAHRVGPTNATVLLIGETGTGKDVLANALHLLSGRRDRSFIPVNCAVMPKEIIESELFGHERGSFTGAETRRSTLGVHGYAVRRSFRGGWWFPRRRLRSRDLDEQPKRERDLAAHQPQQLSVDTNGVGLPARDPIQLDHLQFPQPKIHPNRMPR
jgi:hypothetical protein